jgi:hypothetical protein
MSTEKSVTSEGIPPSLDLGNVEPPNEDSINSLDEAMRAAGIVDAFEDSPAAPEKTSEPAPETPSADAENPAKAQEPETPAEDAEAAQPESIEPKSSDSAELDLDAIQPPADISPRNLVNFNKLREVAKHYKTEASRLPELETRLRELESHQTGIPENIEKELNELRAFRQVFDTENDPEFQREFNEKIGNLDEDILAILRKNGLPEDTEKQLREVGLDQVAPTWWEKSVLEKLSFVDRERVQKRLAERADIHEQKHRELEKFASRREEYLQNSETQRAQEFQNFQSEIYQHVDKLTSNVPWARYREPSKNASEAEIKEVAQHNKIVEELEKNFQEALFPSSAQARAEVAAAAVASTRLASSVQDLATRLQDANGRAEKLQKELDAIRSAGKAPSSRPAARKAASESGDQTKLSDEDAIEQGLLAAESAM